jgi:hypothetical protein
VAQFFMGAAALFAGVGGEFDAVDGEHLAANQALGIAGQQDLAEQRFDLAAEVGDELGDVRVAGLAVATDGDELDVARTGLFNGAAGNQALAVGQQDDFEHHARVVGAGTHCIVLELSIQRTEVELMVDQVVQRKGKTAWDDLLRQDHRQQQAVAILGFVAGHGMSENVAIYRKRL